MMEIFSSTFRKIVSTAVSHNSRQLRTPPLYLVTRRCSVQIVDGGKGLSVCGEERGGGEHYYAKWLRHSCRCPRCLTSSGQVTVSGAELRGALTITQAAINNGSLFIRWEREGLLVHEGRIELKWLKEQAYSEQQLQENCSNMEPVVTQSLPEESYEDIMNSDEGLWRWLKALNHYGMCLVTGVPDREEEISCIFDVRSEDDPINIAYSNTSLGCHIDLVYYQSPPGLQMLHCYRRDSCVEGGMSSLLDGYAIANKMRELHPAAFSSLTRLPATFQKIHFERDSPVSMIYRQPHFVTDRTDRVIRINWAPYFCGPLSLPKKDLEEYYEAFTILDGLISESTKINHHLVPGQALVFNNQRILHGRSQIILNGGVRHLKGAYINIDEFVSKFAVLSRQLKKTVHIKHVLNGSYYM